MPDRPLVAVREGPGSPVASRPVDVHRAARPSPRSQCDFEVRQAPDPRSSLYHLIGFRSEQRLEGNLAEEPAEGVLVCELT